MRVARFFLLLIVFSCSRPFPEAGDESLLCLLSTEDVCDLRHFIFVSSAKYTGSLKGTSANGIAGADALCAQEKDANFKALPGTGKSYAALINDGLNRAACTAAYPNCNTSTAGRVDWVLQADADYLRPDGLLLFRTNSVGVFTFGSMTHPFSDAGADEWWTGLLDDWGDSTQHCTNWAVTGGQAFYGTGASTDSAAISFLTPGNCITPRHLLCVRR